LYFNSWEGRPPSGLAGRPLTLAVDYEQNTRNQCADSRDDVKYCAKTYTKKTQAGDYQEDSEQDPFQLIHVHFDSPLS
jgi:hypothetical protein